MKKTLYILALAVAVFAACTLFGQRSKELVDKQDLRPLTIGDTVPNVYLASILNYNKTSGNLSEFMDKPLIIDFWFRECGSCIKAMPHLDSLKKEYEGRLNLIFSTHQGKDKIEDFFKNDRRGKKHKFINVVNDTVLKQLFPAVAFPHQVWIDKNGVVVAITDGLSTTRSNVEKLVSGAPLNLEEKQDEMDFDVAHGTEPLITYFNKQKPSILQYSFLSKYRKGFVGGMTRTTDTLHNSSRVNIRNIDFIRLYDCAYNPPMGTEALHRPTRIVRKDSNPIKTEADFNTMTNIFCYDIIYQGGPDYKKQSEIMIHDLDTYFNVKSSLEKRLLPCYVMREIGTSKAYQNVLSPNEKPFIENKILEKHKKLMVNNFSKRFFLKSIIHHIDKPLIMEIDSSKRINFEVTWNPEDLDGMNRELRKFDLEIVVEERPREVIVLRDK